MKRILSMVVLSAMLLATFQTGIVWLNYSIQKGIITELYCVNKTKPQLHCNGKCHVVKQLDEKDEGDRVPPPELREFSPGILAEPIADLSMACCRIDYPEPVARNFMRTSFGIFRPPR